MKLTKSLTLCYLLIGSTAVSEFNIPAQAGELSDLFNNAKTLLKNEVSRRLAAPYAQTSAYGIPSTAQEQSYGQTAYGASSEYQSTTDAPYAQNPIAQMQNTATPAQVHVGPVINGFGSRRVLSAQQYAELQLSAQAKTPRPSSTPVPGETAQGYAVPADAGVPMYKRHEGAYPAYFPMPAYPGSKTSEAYLRDGYDPEQCLGLLTHDSCTQVSQYYINWARLKGYRVMTGACPEDCSNYTLVFRDAAQRDIRVELFHDGWTEIQLSYPR
jgi:hypothetical protein